MSKLAASQALLRLLGTELPIIQAPMAGVQTSALAVAVCQGGWARLASLRDAHRRYDAQGAGGDPRRHGQTLQRQLLLPRAAHSERSSAKPRGGERWRRTSASTESTPMRSLRRQHARRSRPSRPMRSRNSSPASSAFISACQPPELVARVKRWGSKVLASATTVDEARWLEANGADAIIAQGVEAGGHRGMFLTDDVSTQLGTFALVPQIARAVQGARHRRRRHRRRRRRRGRDGARCRRRAGRHRLSALPRGHDERRAPRGAEERCRARDGAHQFVHRDGRRAAS